MVTVLDEVLVQIPQRHLEGWWFLAFIGLFPLIVLAHFISNPIIAWTIDLGFLPLYIYIFAKIVDTQMKAGPARAGFRHGTTSAWVSVDEDELVIRGSKTEAYKPSRIEWKTANSFTVRDGKMDFDLIFQNTDEAKKFASNMKTHMPKIVESNIPITTRVSEL